MKKEFFVGYDSLKQAWISTDSDSPLQAIFIQGRRKEGEGNKWREALRCPYCGKGLGVVLDGEQRCFYCGNRFLVITRYGGGKFKQFVRRLPRVVEVKGHYRWNWKAGKYVWVKSYRRSKPKKKGV